MTVDSLPGNMECSRRGELAKPSVCCFAGLFGGDGYDEFYLLGRSGLEKVEPETWRTHGKYVLVRGHYGADRSAFVVMTGSANWTDGALRLGDENTLTIALRGAYRQYRRNWEAVRRHSRRLAAP